MAAVATCQISENEKLVDRSCQISENDGQSVDRRMGKYHANVWHDDFLQSLSSPYGEASYRERVESLIEQIKENAFNPLLGDGEICPSSSDLLQRFFIVDAVQRLGIHRYFEKEIKVLLDYTYKYWNVNGISWGTQNSTADLRSTALGFRILRLNGYHVSPEVFRNFQDENGQFVLTRPVEEGDNELRSVLSLYQAAEICFPGETILREAKSFASRYLQQTLGQSHEKSQLLTEVDYFLKFSWRSRNPRWEAWSSIQIFRQDVDSWMSMEGVYKIPNEICQTILEAAILDFNIIQAQHQIELKIISKWWTEASVNKLNFFRHRHVEYYLAYACGLYEHEFSLTRVGYAKLGTIITVIDDIFDTYGTYDELIHFKEAVINWDMSMINRFPKFMQICLQFTHETYMELADEAEKIHGPRARKWMQEYWTNLILAEFKDAEWIATDYRPTLDEYLKNALDSSTVPVVTLFPMLLINTSLPDDILERIKKIELDVMLGCRLIDDCKDFQEQLENGENASWLDCYIRDNPGTTMEQALEHASILTELHMEELTKDFLFYEKDIPTCCKKVYFDCMYRWVAFLWRDIDGFSTSFKGTKDDIMKLLINPIPLISDKRNM
ncbi:sesquiterpene synthase Cad-like [Cryptomeria japonica]|uniref:sesquiterpene synthase Cad-like n=1 Tax=Cryptomeria japonica TaxID=3369 RepID=UPI0027D9F79A|nr:sesquiterpene synthase Cad-like [Cryptomeria japonica]